MYEIIVQLPFNGFYINGKLSLPVKAKNLIIFSHGLGHSASMPLEKKMALKFQQEGFGTLVFDLMDARKKSPVDSLDTDLLGEGLLTLTNWLHNHSQYHSFNLAYFGYGIGSAAALKATSELQSLIQAVVSLSGRIDLAEPFLPQITCPTLLIVGELDFKTLNINRKFSKRLPAKKQLAVVPGASHLFEEPDKMNEAGHIAISWLKKHMPLEARKTLSQ